MKNEAIAIVVVVVVVVDAASFCLFYNNIAYCAIDRGAWETSQLPKKMENSWKKKKKNKNKNKNK